MNHWRTTAAGIVTAAAGFVVFSPEMFAHWPLLVALAKYAAIGGFAAMGIAGADSKGK